MNGTNGSQKDIQHNQKLFFIDGITFMPSMALISIVAVIPFFLSQLGATTFQIALASSMPMICGFLMQPFFGFIASRSKLMHKTFGKILLTQRVFFLLFILLIPVFAGAGPLLVFMFLVFWGIFNLFVGSYSIFHASLVIRLLPPGKRGAIRGIGLAIGSFLGVGMSALIPVIINRITFPYDYMTIFSLGLFFLFINAVLFLFMRQNKDAQPNEPMAITQYIKKMPIAIKENKPFRAMLITTLFLAVANSLLPYYTLYAIRNFSTTETHIAALTGLAVLSGAFAQVGTGYIADKFGPRITAMIAASLIITAGTLALTTNSLNLLFIAWVFANLSNGSYFISLTLLMGEVCETTKLPLFIGVHATIAMILSAVMILLLAPVLENMGFIPLFSIILTCGLISLMVNVFILRKRMTKI